MNLSYLSFNDVLIIHKHVLFRYGGSEGIRDNNPIKYVVDIVQNDLYYPTIFEKAAV